MTAQLHTVEQPLLSSRQRLQGLLQHAVNELMRICTQGDEDIQ